MQQGNGIESGVGLAGPGTGSLRKREVAINEQLDTRSSNEDTLAGSNNSAENGLPSNRVVTERGTRSHPQSRQNTQNSQNTASGRRPTFTRMFTDLFVPERKIANTPTYKQSILAILKASWLNVLLICVPISFALHFAKVNDIAIFLVSFFAIVPLAKLLGFATEEIALRVGATLGGLINATLGVRFSLFFRISSPYVCCRMPSN